ncbi:MAG: MFS transporter, partial [Duncaniella sp.]|nr:MFS transporter [Duncaniella sp.]
MRIKPIQVRLAALSFLEFAVWGAYLISLGNFLGNVGLATQIGWFYAVQGIVSLIMPAIVGIVADRWVQAQKMLSLCHVLAGAFMGAAGVYCLTTSTVEFAPLFTLYTMSVAFFMPTIGLANSVAFNALTREGLDTITHFPPIRVFGTVGFICSMLFVNFTQFQTNALQLITSAVLSFCLAVYSLSMPQCPVNSSKGGSLADSLGLSAFKLFKQRRMAIFFLFSML